MIAEKSNLTLLNAHASSPKVYWNGVEVTGVTRVRVLSDEDTNRVKLVVSGTQAALYQEMRAAGITVKEI